MGGVKGEREAILALERHTEMGRREGGEGGREGGREGGSIMLVLCVQYSI